MALILKIGFVTCKYLIYLKGPVNPSFFFDTIKRNNFLNFDNKTLIYESHNQTIKNNNSNFIVTMKQMVQI
jgi:hypothetical protein